MSDAGQTTQPRVATLLPMTLLGLIFIGTPLLKMPFCAPAGYSISWIEAMFTAVSAVTLTGLSAVDTATRFSPIGKAVICLLIQLGGLAILSAGALLASRAFASKTQPQPSPKAVITRVVITTLAIEAIAALLMFPLWRGELTYTDRAAVSVFHAVSAFCNAGFSLQSGSLVNDRYAMLSHLFLAPLIVLGGLGWPVLTNLAATLRNQARLSKHTKLVLTTTACAYLVGTLTIAAAQLAPRTYDYFKLGNEPNKTIYQNTTASTVGAALADASFMTISARTGGLSTVPMNDLTPASNVAIMALMAVGGSPGGAAGGMKTVVIALLTLNILAVIRGQNTVRIFGTEVPEAMVRRASAVLAMFVVFVTAATIVLCVYETAPFIKIAFDVVSATTNSGLSLGVTGTMTGFGKAVLIVCMFVGRIGPIAFIIATMTAEERDNEQEIFITT